MDKNLDEHQLLEKIRNSLLQTHIETTEQKEKTNLLTELGAKAITSLKIEQQRIFIVISLPQRLVSQAGEIEEKLKDSLKPHLAGRELALVLTSGSPTGAGAKIQDTKSQESETNPPKLNKRKGGIENVKTILAVASGKGGVGKSTLAVNISIALSQMSATQANGIKEKNLKIGLLDADLYGPSLVQMLALDKPPKRNNEELIIPEKRFGLSTLSMGAMIKDGQALIWRGPLIARALKQLLEGTAWGELDILILDLPPGTGDLPLTLAQNAHIDAALLVSTPQQVALYDVRKSKNMFDKLKIPIVGIIENMSMFQCLHCGEESPIFASGGSQKEAEKEKIPFLGKLPISQDLQESCDNASPIMAHKNLENDRLKPESKAQSEAQSEAQKAHFLRRQLHIQELSKNISSIAKKLVTQLEKLQKTQDMVE